MRRRRFWLGSALVLVIFAGGQADAADVPVEVTTRRVELNTATAEQLTALPGIGQGRARDIIRYRQRRAFRRPADLLRVRGIGRRTYARLKRFLRVEPVAPAAKSAHAARGGSKGALAKRSK